MANHRMQASSHAGKEPPVRLLWRRGATGFSAVAHLTRPSVASHLGCLAQLLLANSPSRVPIHLHRRLKCKAGLGRWRLVMNNNSILYFLWTRSSWTAECTPLKSFIVWGCNGSWA
jgi:hypothetical protein